MTAFCFTGCLSASLPASGRWLALVTDEGIDLIRQGRVIERHLLAFL